MTRQSRPRIAVVGPRVASHPYEQPSVHGCSEGVTDELPGKGVCAVKCWLVGSDHSLDGFDQTRAALSNVVMRYAFIDTYRSQLSVSRARADAYSAAALKTRSMGVALSTPLLAEHTRDRGILPTRDASTRSLSSRLRPARLERARSQRAGSQRARSQRARSQLAQSGARPARSQ